MKYVTLTTDYGAESIYKALLHMKIKAYLPERIIQDISHTVPPFNLNYASYVLKNLLPVFPQNTIHLVDIIDTEIRNNIFAVGIIHGQYVISRFSKVFVLIDEHQWEGVWEYPSKADPKQSDMDVMLYIAQLIDRNRHPSSFAYPVSDYRIKMPFHPTVSGNVARGMIIYFDNYGNAVFNITHDWYQQHVGNRLFQLVFKNYRVEKIHTHYTDVEKGEILFCFNSFGYLQLSMRNDDARKRLGLSYGDTLLIMLEP